MLTLWLSSGRWEWRGNAQIVSRINRTPVLMGNSTCFEAELPVPVWTSPCTYLKKYLYLLEQVPVLIWITTCTYWDKYLYLFGQLPVPIWPTRCIELRKHPCRAGQNAWFRSRLLHSSSRNQTLKTKLNKQSSNIMENAKRSLFACISLNIRIKFLIL